MAEAPRVLVLGASGFLGRHVVAALEAAGDAVLGVGGPSGSGPAWRRLDLVTGDLVGLVREADPDAIVNCAGRTVGSADALENDNVVVVRRLLEAIADRTTRLVHLGSAAEYGPGRPDHPTSEADHPAPVADYGRSKLRATTLVVDSGLDAAVLRVFNPVGAGMGPESLPGRAARLIADALAHGSGSITLGPLAARRDFVDARDVADAVLAATRLSGGPRVINVGSGHAALVRELVTTLADVAGYRGTVSEEQPASPRSERVEYQCADIGLARAALGWEPSRGLRDAVTALWQGVSGDDVPAPPPGYPA